MYAYLIRTLVPLLVGVIVGQAARVGLDLDPTAVYAIVTPAATLVYGLVSRWIELHVPAAGRVLLAAGLTRQSPEYTPWPARR
ncbi:hypothetical protein [Actinomadura rubrisoli]|uniref:Uncharacterized protein n=1 Tax=Actinomadura rubrisoli TaxID=2530368 RepID=A0A4R5BS09_9ACTN|nr:hypothetical protein [Actinomadura rubrisoli]TDD88346.1 hypothetical protein E1298_15150 [Actinomadura rubrisoli]